MMKSACCITHARSCRLPVWLSAQNNPFNPVFNTTFTFQTRNKAAVLALSVEAKNILKISRVLGQASVNVADFRNAKVR